MNAMVTTVSSIAEMQNALESGIIYAKAMLNTFVLINIICQVTVVSLGLVTSIAAGLANEENRRWTKRITVGGAATITAVTALMALFHPQESMARLNVLSVQYIELATQFALDASHVQPGADEDLKLRASYSQKMNQLYQQMDEIIENIITSTSTNAPSMQSKHK
jgi:hypothetical protein